MPSGRRLDLLAVDKDGAFVNGNLKLYHLWLLKSVPPPGEIASL